ncbi:MAG TPA: hypothetical protein PLN21_01440 [Gemmatales bacterium]|nr:hypothetical protein [Gemmatales bacterium]
MKCRQRLLEGIVFGIIISLLGGLLGVISARILYATRHQEVLWDTHVQGSGGFAMVQKENKLEGNSGSRETFDGQVVSECFSWICKRPDEYRGVKDFKRMLVGICSFTGWFVGILTGIIYLIISVILGRYQTWVCNHKNLLISSMNLGSTFSPESLSL